MIVLLQCQAIVILGRIVNSADEVYDADVFVRSGERQAIAGFFAQIGHLVGIASGFVQIGIQIEFQQLVQYFYLFRAVGQARQQCSQAVCGWLLRLCQGRNEHHGQYEQCFFVHVNVDYGIFRHSNRYQANRYVPIADANLSDFQTNKSREDTYPRGM